MLATTLVILIALLGILGVSAFMARRRFRAQITKEVGELFRRAQKGLGPEQFADRCESLPEPVGRYVRFAVAQNAPIVRTARLRHCGLFRISPKRRWLPIEGQAFFTIDEPGFIWNATIALLPFLWIEARDRLIDGRGNMLVKFCSLFTLVNASGKELDQGALLRWLAEVVWFPIGYLGDRIGWDPIDSQTAQATLTHNGLSVTGNVEVDEEGKLVSIRGWRYRVENGRSELTPWKGVCSCYRQFGGMRIPTSVEVLWELSEGDFSYAKFDVSSVEYDSSEFRPATE
jgi:uncharacterized protein DUF6544